MTNDLNTILELANQVASKSDRYLFIFVSIVLFFFGWLVVRWLANKTEKQNEVLVTIAKDQNETAKHLATVIALNTSALTENTGELRSYRQLRPNVVNVVQQPSQQ